jgi:hypothetical protein
MPLSAHADAESMCVIFTTSAVATQAHFLSLVLQIEKYNFLPLRRVTKYEIIENIYKVTI